VIVTDGKITLGPGSPRLALFLLAESTAASFFSSLAPQKLVGFKCLFGRSSIVKFAPYSRCWLHVKTIKVWTNVAGLRMTMSTGCGRIGRDGRFVRKEAHWVDQDRGERTEAFGERTEAFRFKCIDNQIYSNANKEISLYKRMRCFRYESVSRTDESLSADVLLDQAET
jgi:hypothetical protein